MGFNGILLCRHGVGGYPEKYQKGYEITGLSDVKTLVFHAGTRLEDNRIVTNGGRVLAVTAVAEHLEDAIDAAYREVSKSQFRDRHFRTDIGHRVVVR